MRALGGRGKHISILLRLWRIRFVLRLGCRFDYGARDFNMIILLSLVEFSKRQRKPKNFLSISFSASRRRGGGRRRAKNARKFLGLPRASSRAPRRFQRDRSVLCGFKPPRTRSVRSQSGFRWKCVRTF